MQQQLVELFVFPSHVRNDGLKIISRIALLGYVSLKGWCHSQICPIKFHALGSMSSCAVLLYDLFVSAWLQSPDALGDGYRCLFGQKGKFGSPQIHMVFSQLLGEKRYRCLTSWNLLWNSVEKRQRCRDPRLSWPSQSRIQFSTWGISTFVTGGVRGSQQYLRYVFWYVKLILEKNLKEWSLINLDILDV